MAIDANRAFAILVQAADEVTGTMQALTYLRNISPEAIRLTLTGQVSEADMRFLLEQARELQGITGSATGPSVERSARQLGDVPPILRLDIEDVDPALVLTPLQDAFIFYQVALDFNEQNYLQEAYNAYAQGLGVLRDWLNSGEFRDDAPSLQVAFLVREAMILFVGRMLPLLDELQEAVGEGDEIEDQIFRQRTALVSERSGRETQNSILSVVLRIPDLEMLRSLGAVVLLAEASRLAGGFSDVANARAWFGEELERARLSDKQREFLEGRVSQTERDYENTRRIYLELEPDAELPSEEKPRIQTYEYPYDDADKLRTRLRLVFYPETLTVVITSEAPLPQYSADGFPLPSPNSLFGINPEVLGLIGKRLTTAEQMEKGKNPYRAALTLFEATEGLMSIGHGFLSQRAHPHIASMAYAGANFLAPRMIRLWDNQALVIQKARAENPGYDEAQYMAQGFIFNSYRTDIRDISLVQRINYPFGTDDYDRIARWGERGIVSSLLIHSGYLNLGRGMMYRERDPGLAMAALGQSAFDFSMTLSGLNDLLQGKKIINDWEKHLIAYTINRLIARIRQARAAFEEIKGVLETVGFPALDPALVERARAQASLTNEAFAQLEGFFDFETISANLRREFGEAITAESLLEEDEAETRASSFWILDSMATLEQHMGGFLEVNVDWDEPGKPPYLIRLPQTIGISGVGVEFLHDNEVAFSLPENLGPTFPNAIVDNLVNRLNAIRDLPPLMGMNTLTIRYGEVLRPYARNEGGEFVPILTKKGGRGGSTPSRSGPPPRGSQRTSAPESTPGIIQFLEAKGYNQETIEALADAGYDFEELAQIIKRGDPEAVEEALASLEEFTEIDPSSSLARRSPALGATLVRSVRPIEVLARL